MPSGLNFASCLWSDPPTVPNPSYHPNADESFRGLHSQVGLSRIFLAIDFDWPPDIHTKHNCSDPARLPHYDSYSIDNHPLQMGPNDRITVCLLSWVVAKVLTTVFA